MTTRLSRRRMASAVSMRPAGFDSLESRYLMSVAVAKASTSILAGAQNSVVATIKPLKALTKATAAAFNAAGADLFTGVSSFGAAANGVVNHIATKSATPFGLNLAGIESALSKAPAEFTKGAKDVPVVLALPMPDGTLSRFKIVRSEVMDPALARQFPSIRTYRGIGIDDPTADIRLDTTPAGFHAQVLSPTGAYYIDPYFLNDAKGTYVSYNKADAVKTEAWMCAFVGSDVKEKQQTALELALADDNFEVAPITYGGTLKTFRAAVAGNRSYITAATTGVPGGATTANGQAAIVTAMNRVTGVYESELSIRLTLVATNSTVVYGTDNPLADPYSNSTSAINQNTGNLNTRIGVSNYDIGHVFTTGSGGVAQLGCVGGSSKGAGTTGTSSPIGDAFTIDYVAHEMGHQFGANHTFNTALDTGNRNATTAYEPGSGLSIMAYAGIEGTDDLAAHSIPYFHGISIDEIRSFIGTIPSVGTTTSTGDLAPVVSAGSDYVIPASTPFALTATGSDADGDVLTYDWQEFDRGAATQLSTADNGASPLFTQTTPSTSRTRTLPRLNSILGGFLNTVAGGSTATAANVLGAGSNTASGRLAERMYTAARTASTWRVIARDNRGGVSTDDMALKVVSTGSAFAISNLNSAATLAGGSNQTISWNVAGTTAAQFNASTVNILLSLDGGQTFTTTLASGVANDGSETVKLPFGVGSTQARIKIQPTGNIFFDINNANLTITNVAATSATPGAPLLAAASDSGVSSSDGITNLNNVDSATALTYSVPGTVAGALVEIIADNVVIGSAIATGTTTSVTTNGLTLLVDGTRPVTARQTEAGKPVSAQSAGTSITIDTVAPTVVPLADRFDFELEQTLTFEFVGADESSITSDVLAVELEPDSTAVPAILTYVPEKSRATFSFVGILADGDYEAKINAGLVYDTAGNALDEVETHFFVLAGDANRDRTVNFDDLVVLSQNYGTTGEGKSFSAGNFNYSADGAVDFDDLVILSQNYSKSLDPTPPEVQTVLAPVTTSGKSKSKRVPVLSLVS